MPYVIQSKITEILAYWYDRGGCTNYLKYGHNDHTSRSQILIRPHHLDEDILRDSNISFS